MRKKLRNYFEIIAFLYFAIGVFFGFIIEVAKIDIGIFEFIAILYMDTFLLALFLYFIYGILIYKHKSIFINIIDSIMYLLTIFGLISIYDFSKVLYYLIGLCFSLSPLLYSIIDKERDNLYYVLRIITRILMVLFLILIVLMLGSCSVGIAG